LIGDRACTSTAYKLLCNLCVEVSLHSVSLLRLFIKICKHIFISQRYAKSSKAPPGRGGEDCLWQSARPEAGSRHGGTD